MSFDADIAAALPDMFKEFEEAVFNPAAGASIPCHVDIRFNVLLQPAGVETQTWAQGTTIDALLSEIGRAPVRGETFTVNSIIYKVDSIPEKDGFVVKAVVT